MTTDNTRTFSFTSKDNIDDKKGSVATSYTAKGNAEQSSALSRLASLRQNACGSAASTPATGASPSPHRTFTSFSKKPDSTTQSSLSGSGLFRSQSQVAGTGPTVRPSTAFRPKENAANPAPTFKAASPFRKDLSITDEEFVLIRDFIYKQCGIFIAENRKYLIENRLSNRIKELNLKSYNEYYKYLRFDDKRADELNKLFVMVTTNETSFFRNPPQLEIFQNVVLAEMLEECRKKGQRKLRIWSAGCSTGEEPYTLAIILNEVLKTELRSWDIKITANDLSVDVLAAAKKGIYNEYALRTTPKAMVEKYFTKDGNVYKLNEDLKRLVNFSQINLSDKEQLKKVERSNIVFCRNVIIYFDDEMKRKVVNAFYDNLVSKGVLLIGHSESLHNICRAFHLEHHKGTIVYRKPE